MQVPGSLNLGTDSSLPSFERHVVEQRILANEFSIISVVLYRLINHHYPPEEP